jgi:uncharacterized protein YyaL (SSP411 family)
MPNRLAAESSPYLLQHQHNPVDWYPWGPEALERAKQEQKPIFLSIGYSACHWCHVMEHESFENAEIAKLLNQRFVCIKVDREERPDLDQVYMNAVQLMTGRGGWPMSVFLTPDLQPFYGGTYWPPHDARGMPGFDRIILAVHDAWVNRREQALAQAAQLTEHLSQIENEAASQERLRPEVLQQAAAKLARVFDSTYGGFGSAPKFPHSMDLQLLLRMWKRDPQPQWLHMVRHTLDKMSHGGIYDHLAGGFARYSVDERWLVPHFEKMLYDNALLTLAYLEGHVVTGDEHYANVARETCNYILKTMTDARGGFYSTEDADSEGEEGKFYVWTPAEIRAVLGADRGGRFCEIYNVTEQGNFEHGSSILNLPISLAKYAAARNLAVDALSAELAADRAQLLLVRDQRERPHRDDKILVSWNALMIDALARASGILHEPRYYLAAEKAAKFILTELRDANGRLLHTWRNGQAKLSAYLDGYAYLINALVSLYEAHFQERWIDEAVLLADSMLANFRAPTGGFYYTAHDHEQLIARQKELHDSSVPSGNSMAAYALLRLGSLTGRQDYRDAAAETLAISYGLLERSPTAAGQMLLAADWLIGPTHEFALAGEYAAPGTQAVLEKIRHTYLPNMVLACRGSQAYQSPHLNALFQGRPPAANGDPVLFICTGHTCEIPLVGQAAIAAKL